MLLHVVAAALGLALLAGLVALLKPPRPSVDGLPEGFTEGRVELGEVTLAYVQGPDNGPPLVLIPGQMESWQGYRRVMPALARTNQVFVVDMRGHGGSTRTPGRYSYVICGQDVKAFLEQVVQAPAVVSGLSSGGVIAAWVAANAPAHVRGAVLEDPPIYSSLWPRIQAERFMRRMFEVAVETLGKPEGRDLEAYFLAMGIPDEGSDALKTIPPGAVRALMALKALGERLRPAHPYDTPLLPFNLRAGHKFLSEYDVDFSAATADGRLSEGFDADATLSAIQCPVLYLHADWSRHETWGLLGAADDADVARVRAHVPDLRVVRVASAHEIHMTKPERYLQEVEPFLRALPA